MSKRSSEFSQPRAKRTQALSEHFKTLPKDVRELIEPYVRFVPPCDFCLRPLTQPGKRIMQVNADRDVVICRRCVEEEIRCQECKKLLADGSPLFWKDWHDQPEGSDDWVHYDCIGKCIDCGEFFCLDIITRGRCPDCHMECSTCGKDLNELRPGEDYLLTPTSCPRGYPVYCKGCEPADLAQQDDAYFVKMLEDARAGCQIDF